MAVMLERWNDDKMDALDEKVDRLEVRLAGTDGKLDGLCTKVDRLELDVEKLDTKLDKVNDRLMYALLAVFGSGATIAGAVLAAPHL